MPLECAWYMPRVFGEDVPSYDNQDKPRISSSNSGEHARRNVGNVYLHVVGEGHQLR